MTTKEETARMMFEYVQEKVKRSGTYRAPTREDVLSSYEILMYQVCSFDMTNMLKSLLNKLNNISPEQNHNDDITPEDYRSCLLYDCLAVALEKNHDSVVRTLLAFVTKREFTLTTSLKCKSPYTLLHCAAANGDVNIISLLISSGCNVNQINAKEETALHFACDASTAEILLDHGADVDGMQSRNTPLYYACASSRLGVVNKLLDWGASTNLGSAKLNEACKSRVESRIADILHVFRSNDVRLNSLGVCILNARSFHGSNQPLCSTCKHENPLLVEKLRENVNLKIYKNGSQLNQAIWEVYEKKKSTGTEDIEEIQLILSKSKQSVVNAVNKSGTTPLYVAVERNLIEVAKLLLACGANPNLTTSGKYPLVVACKYLSHEFVSILLTGGADTNVVDFQGESPLCLAALSYDHRLVKLLVELGADVKQTDKRGRTAFYACIEQMSFHQAHHSCLSATAECIKVATYLIDNGSNLDHTIGECDEIVLYTLIGYAFNDRSCRFFRRSLCFQLFDLLLECGADVRKAGFQQSPMLAATQLNNPYVVQEFLRHGGNANERSESEFNYGESVLNIACHLDSTLIVRILLAAGADPNSITWRCSSWLLRNSEILDLLLNYGVIGDIPKDVVVGLSYHSQTSGLLSQAPYMTRTMAAKQNANLSAMAMPAKENAELSNFFVTSCREAKGLTRLFSAGCSLKFLATYCDGRLKQITSTSCAQLAARLCQAIALVEFDVQHQQLVNLLKQSGRPKDNDLASWFDKNSMTPPSLLRLSRSATRRHLSAASGGRTILPLIDVLEIPIQMQMYLRFEGPWSEVNFAVSSDVTSNDACSCK